MRKALRANKPEEAERGSIDLVYQLPGQIAQPGFEGIRTGEYSNAEKLLMEQVSVPTSALSDSIAARGFLFDSLCRAVETAKDFFDEEGIGMDFRAEVLAASELLAQ